MAKNLSSANTIDIKRCAIALILLISISSCKENFRDVSDTSYLRPIANTENIHISQEKNTSLIKLEYATENEMSSEYIASFIAMSYCDSVGENLAKSKIEYLKIQLGYPNYMDTFLYNIALMKQYKKGLETTSTFINNMLNDKSEQSNSLVDPSKISSENLLQVNTVGREIRENFQPKKISYDGFLIIPNESNKIQTKVRFTNQSEEMYLNFQYDINTGKIFYFGVND